MTNRYFAALFFIFALTWVCADDAPLIVAHRGVPNEAPVNTLTGFKLAWAQGADAIEVDVWMSFDRKMVCLHDQRTNKVADKDVPVMVTRWEELKKLDVGSRFSDAFKGERIPLLAEVLQTVPDTGQIFVDLKAGRESVDSLLETLRASKVPAERIWILSYHYSALQEVERLAPEYRTSLMIAFERIHRNNVGRSADSALYRAEKAGLDALSMQVGRKLPRDFIQRAKEKGFPTHVWTVNRVYDARKWADLGAASITTDHPAEIRKAIKPNAKK